MKVIDKGTGQEVVLLDTDTYRGQHLVGYATVGQLEGTLLRWATADTFTEVEGEPSVRMTTRVKVFHTATGQYAGHEPVIVYLPD